MIRFALTAVTGRRDLVPTPVRCPCNGATFRKWDGERPLCPSCAGRLSGPVDATLSRDESVLPPPGPQALVIAIDVSGTMLDGDHAQRVVAALTESLAELRSHDTAELVRIALVAFAEDACRLWPASGGPTFGPLDALPAGWFDGWSRLKSGTSLLDLLQWLSQDHARVALDGQLPLTVVILTDGEIGAVPEVHRLLSGLRARRAPAPPEIPSWKRAGVRVFGIAPKPDMRAEVVEVFGGAWTRVIDPGQASVLSPFLVRITQASNAA